MKKPPNPLIQAVLATFPMFNAARMGQSKPAQAPQSELQRPELWPQFMAWPPGDLLAEFERADQERRELIRKQLATWNAEMQKRGVAARSWLIETYKLDPNSEALPMGGVMFASLVSPGGVPPALGQVVAKWGFNSLTTRDGGELVATAHELRLRRGTPEAVQALVIEAKKRGWPSIEVSGSKNFKKQVALEAAKYGLAVRSRDAMGKSILISTGQPELERHLAAANVDQKEPAKTPDPATPASAPKPPSGSEGPSTPVATPAATGVQQAPDAGNFTGMRPKTVVSDEHRDKVVVLDEHRDKARPGPAGDVDPEPRPA